MAIEIPLFIPAHFFNSFNIFFPLVMTMLFGANRYDEWLEVEGFRIPPLDTNWGKTFMIGVAFMIFYGLMLIPMIVTVMIMKCIIQR